MEFIDSALGMTYGTVLNPLWIIMNYSAAEGVSSLLTSLVIGGFSASFMHHHCKNTNFQFGSIDMQIAVTIIRFGAFTSIFGTFASISIPKKVLTTHIGLLVMFKGLPPVTLFLPLYTGSATAVFSGPNV
jgi:uncharacterized membrane protein YfcA